MLRVVEEVRPRYFVGENVAGIATMALPGKKTKVVSETDLFGKTDIYRTSQRYVLSEICENLAGIGYAVQPILIPACAVGAPHRRDRIFIIASDTDGNRGREVHEHLQSELSDGQEPERDGRERYAAYTAFVQRNGGTIHRKHGEEQESESGGGGGEKCGAFWRDFPTKSAVCRGNDGIPGGVDSLSVSKWRTETLKAYGNAIVPQVMYEIFLQIQKLEEL